MLFLISSVTILVTLVANSFIEWIVHGPGMHSKWALPYLRKTHEEHHGFFSDDADGYKNHLHGPYVHLPWWSVFFTVGPMALLGLSVAYLADQSVIFWCVTFTSMFYYYAYQYVHTCMHVPKGRWFESTKYFRYLDRYHHAHHVRDEEFARFFHICLLFPLADYVIEWVAKKMKHRPSR